MASKLAHLIITRALLGFYLGATQAPRVGRHPAVNVMSRQV